jgi:hypothetical protein
MQTTRNSTVRAFIARDTASNAVTLIKREVTFENKTETQQKGN